MLDASKPRPYLVDEILKTPEADRTPLERRIVLWDVAPERAALLDAVSDPGPTPDAPRKIRRHGMVALAAYWTKHGVRERNVPVAVSRPRGHSRRAGNNTRTRGSRRTTSTASPSRGDPDGESDPPGATPQAGRDTAGPRCECGEQLPKPKRGPTPKRCADCKRQEDANRKRRTRRMRRGCPGPENGWCRYCRKHHRKPRVSFEDGRLKFAKPGESEYVGANEYIESYAGGSGTGAPYTLPGPLRGNCDLDLRKWQFDRAMYESGKQDERELSRQECTSAEAVVSA